MKKLLDFMEESPVLTTILLVITCDFIINIIKVLHCK
jgi:hypothetical protein